MPKKHERIAICTNDNFANFVISFEKHFGNININVKINKIIRQFFIPARHKNPKTRKKKLVLL